MSHNSYKLLIALLLTILIWSVTLTVKNMYKNNSLNLQLTMLSDTLTKYKNSNNENVAKIAVLEADKSKDFLDIQSKDSVINKLQKEVEYYKKKIKNGGSVTVVGTTTTVYDTTKIYHTDSTSCFNYDNQWISLWGNTISNDLLEFGLTIKNEYTLTIGEEKGKPFVELTNKNPYTDTQYLRTFQVNAPKPKKIGIGFQVGIGYMDKLRPYFGAGISYNIITFRL